ncbi:MAG: WD40-repeat-containing domain protein [Olpidium bornovanus]|uniref:WD40-repeat-containing domain protein n=1 Tax=Olpidium bornovanus TaxID=278681 RepID=A0A8H7ZXS6_9FUNG|nr:MAG: WD40-repeat-containing domain protein [Olpidium bornovanus]
MKFDRHTDAENVDFLVLSDDWTKTVHLQCDRSIEFHSQGGIYYRTRIPKLLVAYVRSPFCAHRPKLQFGRDIAYHYSSCDLLVAAAANEVYRLNLDQGRFLNPLTIDSPDGVNVVKITPLHQLYAFGTVAGTVEFWDPRSRELVNVLRPNVPGGGHVEVSAVSYRDDGLSVGVGTSTGQVLLYDLRSARPWVVKDQGYGSAIRSIHFHECGSSFGGTGKVISADSKIIKIWNRMDGRHFTSIEPTTAINDVCPVENSGLIYAANEGIQVQSYYIPELGPAPRWCSFLDNLTVRFGFSFTQAWSELSDSPVLNSRFCLQEELEEKPEENVYDDFKFVTRKDLASLGLDHLIGTKLLRPYMHGYFVDLRLYEKARAIANPFAYEEHRAQLAKSKVEAERASRIRATTKLPKVNRALASRLLEERETGEGARKKGKRKEGDQPVPTVLEDERFAELFANADFEVDEDSLEFQQLNPTRSTAARRRPLGNDSGEESAGGEDGPEESEAEGKGSDESSSEEEFWEQKKQKKAPDGIRSGAGQRRHPKMVSFSAGRSQASTKSGIGNVTALGERATTELTARRNKGRRPASGAMEMTFNVRKRVRGDKAARGGTAGGGPVRRQRRAA